MTLPKPSCPECDAPYADITWTGGSPPYGPDLWECCQCGHQWETAPVAEMAATAEILTPRCPLCDGPPMALIPGLEQSFCGNDECTLLCWTPAKSLDANLMDAGVVKLPPAEGGTDG